MKESRRGRGKVLIDYQETEEGVGIEKSASIRGRDRNFKKQNGEEICS